MSAPRLSRWQQHLPQASTFSAQVAVTMAANVAIAVLGLVTGSLLARTLGPQGRGELAAIQTWAGFLGLLAALGLPDAVVYFSGRDRKGSATYLTSAVALMVLAAVPLAAAGVLLMPALLSAQSPEVVAIARRYLPIYLLLMATQGMLLHPLRGRGDFVVWNALRPLPALAWLVVIVIVFVAGVASPAGFAAGHLVALAAAGLLTFVAVRRRVPGPYAMRSSHWPPMLRYGVPSALSALPQTLNLRLDQMLMAALLSPALLGYYVVAVAWSSAATPLLQSIGAVLFPRVASEENKTDQVALLGRGTRTTVLLALLLNGALLLITPLAVILIFGRTFAPAVPAALLLVVAAGFVSLNHALEEGLRGLGHTQAVLWGESVGLVATAVGLAVLLRPLQINGAALASLLGYSATTVALLIWLKRRTGQQVLFFVLPGAEDRWLLWQHIWKPFR